MATRIEKAQQSRLIPLQPFRNDTIAKIFLDAVDNRARPDSLQYKRDGTWCPISHREVELRVTRLAAALQSLGIGPGDRVALLSENRPEWAMTDYAVVGMGAIDVPLYPTLPANQLAFILKDAAAMAVFVSTREQLEKLQQIRGELPELRHVVSFEDPAGAEGVFHFPALLERGRAEIEAGNATSFRERALAVRPDDVATLIYTSGTTGDPKGVMLTHYNLASNVAGTEQAGLSEMVLRTDTSLSFLPLSHVFERMVDYLFWNIGVSIAYAESTDAVAANMTEVRPMVVVSVPRLFDKIYTRVMGATGIKKKLLLWAKTVGGEVVNERLAGREPAAGLALRYRIADRLVFSKLRERVGGRMRTFVSGGAPLSADVARFFLAAGLPVYEGYGLTETSPVIAVNRTGAIRLGTVGQAIPGVEIRIEEDGEILTRGPHVMKGYWKNPQATAELIDAGGWLHTGDVGYLDEDGFLTITDRIKNLIVTAGGKNIAPAPIENAAAMSPYVAQAVMIGDRRPFPILLVVPDFENLASWAQRHGIDAGDRARLLEDPQVASLLEGQTLGKLQGLASFELPKKIGIVPQEFSIDTGELTPKLSVKRRVVESRYQDLIEKLYAGEDKVT